MVEMNRIYCILQRVVKFFCVCDTLVCESIWSFLIKIKIFVDEANFTTAHIPRSVNTAL